MKIQKIISEVKRIISYQEGRLTISKLTYKEAVLLDEAVSGYKGYKTHLACNDTKADLVSAVVNSSNCELLVIYCDSYQPDNRMLTISRQIRIK